MHHDSHTLNENTRHGLNVNLKRELQPDVLIKRLQDRDAYPHAVDLNVVVHETHISVVFLAGQYAYKIKRPVKTGFLDYSTLALRKYYCDEEVRLGQRYAADLYMGVVAVTFIDGCIQMEGTGYPIEYAVKMHRFPLGALLSEYVSEGLLVTRDISELAKTIFNFHNSAETDRELSREWPNFFVKNVHEIIETLLQSATQETKEILEELSKWTSVFLCSNIKSISTRVDQGFVRECHGDLHLANVVNWKGKFIPFDGIDFNQHLRWIDVLSDAAFLAMDLDAHGLTKQSRVFLNAYLEKTGDYEGTVVLRIFMVYRALVRALASSMQGNHSKRDSYLILAKNYTSPQNPQLWITHGPSGSGKTTLSGRLVGQRGMIRIRSDIERKRLFAMSELERPTGNVLDLMYSAETTEKIYRRLADLARKILKSGYGVIVDATFLKRMHRTRFQQLAEECDVPFLIVDCTCDIATARDRVRRRHENDHDASDADLTTLEEQLRTRDILSVVERLHSIQFS